MTVEALPLIERARSLGALPLPGSRCRFRVWAPACPRVAVHILDDGRRVGLEPAARGYHEGVIDGVAEGTRYLYSLGETQELPDPASRSQPDGVHGPSRVVDPAYPWTVEAWKNPPLAEHVLYELHVGVFTPHGGFEGVVDRLDELAQLGVTAIELMPIAQFPGARNWGYDGVYPWAAQSSYGGLAGLQRLVDEAHRRGLAVFLDVVYNHLGPEGNYLSEYGPYFTDRYRTPWGRALNFDGADSDEVRAFFIGSALFWTSEARIDGLRLDAVHSIADEAPLTFVEQLTGAVHAAAAQQGRRVHVVAESSANDPRLVREPELGGFGLDGQWNDDFHHSIHALLTGERDGYYVDYGETQHLLRSLEDGYAYTGQYSSFRRRAHGRPLDPLARERLVVFAQNHDQVGNRAQGGRLAELVGLEGAKVAAGLVLLSPFVPLLFMGEEWADPAPFLYFVSHGDPELVAAVREGRRREFAAFAWTSEPPDPQAADTFAASCPEWGLRTQGEHGQVLAFYQELVSLRRRLPALGSGTETEADQLAEAVVCVRRRAAGSEAVVLANLSRRRQRPTLSLQGAWLRLLDSADPRFSGPGLASASRIGGAAGSVVELQPLTLLLYRKEDT